MGKRLKVLVDNVLEEEVERIPSLPADEKTKAIDGIVKLYKVKIDEMEADQKTYDAYDRKAEADREYEQKERQMIEARKDRWIKIGIDVFAIVVPLVVHYALVKDGYHLEEHGSVGSFTLKTLISKFKPTK